MSASPFEKKASDGEGELWELPNPGLHAAVLVALIDIGTHEHEYNSEKSERRSNFVVWQIADQVDSEGKPFFVGQEFNSSLHKKSNWRILLEGWRGRQFGADEAFDPFVLLGVKCVVNLTAKVTGKDKEYMKLGSVATPMKGQAIPDAVVPTFWYHLDVADMSTDPPIPEWVPYIYGRKVADEIKASHEWKAFAQTHKLIPASNGNGQKPDTGPAPQQTQPLQREYAGQTQEREAPPF